MPDSSADLKTLWREQPVEELPVTLPAHLDNRTAQLVTATRSEIVMSVIAALFFGAVVAWRQRLDPLLGTVIALIAAWAVITLLSFRRRLWLSPDVLASAGVDFYRRELERRYKHLTNPWLWYGPLLLACATLAIIAVGGSAYPAVRLRQVWPLLVVLVAWIAYSGWQRRRQAQAIRRELAELADN